MTVTWKVPVGQLRSAIWGLGGILVLLCLSRPLACFVPPSSPHEHPYPGPQERDPGQVNGGSLTGACSYVIRSANIKKEGLERKDTISSCTSPFYVLWIFVIIASGLLMIKCNYAFVVDRTFLLISPVTPPKQQANKPGHTSNLGGECEGRVFSKTCHLDDISFKNISVSCCN